MGSGSYFYLRITLKQVGTEHGCSICEDLHKNEVKRENNVVTKI